MIFSFFKFNFDFKIFRNVRFLKAAGLHPVIFTESQMNELGKDERAMIDFIRQQILNLSDHLHNNDWAEISTSEMADSDDDDAYTREWTQRFLNIPKEKETEDEKAAKNEEKFAENDEKEAKATRKKVKSVRKTSGQWWKSEIS